MELLLILLLMAVVLHTTPTVYGLMRKITLTTEQEKQTMQRFEVLYHHMRPWVSSAGFYGWQAPDCKPKLMLHKTLPYSGMRQGSPVTVYQATRSGWMPPLPPVLVGKLAPGTDALQIEGASVWSAKVFDINKGHSMINLSKRAPEAEWFIISNCEHAEIFRAEPVGHGDALSLRLLTALQGDYGAEAVVSVWQITAFYLDTHLATSGYTLNRKSLMPAEPAKGLLSGLDGWLLNMSDNILQVSLTGREALLMWMRCDHAR